MNKHLTRLNWWNLTSLWSEMGAKPVEWLPGLSGSEEWPRRHWLSNDAGHDQASQLHRLSPNAFLSIFSDHPARRAVGAADLKVRFEQTGMTLALSRHAPGPASFLEVSEVRDEADVRSWIHVASRSFGYAIDAAPIKRLLHSSSSTLLLAHLDGQPAATALLHWTENTCGIHQVGVLPEIQRQGVARQLMQKVLEHAKRQGSSLATLQASPMGRPLYRALGFQEHFTLETLAKPPSPASGQPKNAEYLLPDP